MSNRHLTRCWNCETTLPSESFRGHRCPLCEAWMESPAMSLCHALIFLGPVVGWLGGTVYGAIVGMEGWGVVGAIHGTVVIGGLGGVAAFLHSVAVDRANLDKEVLLRGSEIRRARAEYENAAK